MTQYSIKDLELITGIKAHTIRIWEKRYNILEPARTDTNIRFYSDYDLRRLLSISILNQHGFKISDISRMSNDELQQSVLKIELVANDYESQVNSLINAMVHLDQQRFEKVLSYSAEHAGIEITITGLVSKFLERVGLLWQVGSISPLHEHFITNLLRQRLILSIANLNFYRENARTFVLFLPADEFHEIALLYNYYLIRKAGHNVLYLGQNLPCEYLNEVFADLKPDFFLTSFTVHMEPEVLSKLVKEIDKLPEDTKMLIGGRYADDFYKTYSSKVICLHSAEEFDELLRRL